MRQLRTRNSPRELGNPNVISRSIGSHGGEFGERADYAHIAEARRIVCTQPFTTKFSPVAHRPAGSPHPTDPPPLPSGRRGSSTDSATAPPSANPPEIGPCRHNPTPNRPPQEYSRAPQPGCSRYERTAKNRAPNPLWALTNSEPKLVRDWTVTPKSATPSLSAARSSKSPTDRLHPVSDATPERAREQGPRRGATVRAAVPSCGDLQIKSIVNQSKSSYMMVFLVSGVLNNKFNAAQS